jgi:hypothetical protein
MGKTVVEEFIGVLGWEVDKKQLDAFGESVKSVTGTIKKIAGVVTVAVGAIAALTVVTNRQTAVSTKLARSFGVNIEQLENWGFLLSAIGINQNSVLKSAKKLNLNIGNAIGGIGESKAINDAVKSLGLNLKDLSKLAPEEQFEKVLNAAKNSENAQVGVAAATALIGRNAQELVGFLRTQEGSMSEILALQGRMNLQTEQGRQGAIDFIGAMDDSLAVFDSAKALFSGLVGGGLAPMLRMFTAWVAANRDLIQIQIKKWVRTFIDVLKFLLRALGFVFDKIKRIIDLLGGWNKALKMTTFFMAGLVGLRTLTALSSFVALIRAAGVAQAALAVKTGLTNVAMAGLKGVGLGLFALIAEDIWTMINGGDSVVGRLTQKIQPAFDSFANNILSKFGEINGMTLDETQKVFSGFVGEVGSLRFLLDNAGQWWAGFFSDIFGGIKGVDTNIKTWIADTGNSFNNFFRDMLRNVRDFGKKITSFLPDFVTGGTPNPATPGGSSPVPASPGLLNQSNSNKVTINQTNNVTQQPGQSAGALGAALAGGIGEQVSRAVRNANTGVVY